MKKHKKLLSVLLSMLMVLSAVSAGLVVFAAGPDGAVTALEEKITAYAGNMNTTTPTDADKAAYDELVAGFKALTDDQKNSIDVVALDKLTQLMYVYECALASNGSSYVSSTVRKEVAAKVVAELNAPDINAAQKAFDDGIIASSGIDTQERIALYRDLSDTAKVIVGTADRSAGLFRYSMNADNNSQQYAFNFILGKIVDEMIAADPYTATERPSLGDYEGGSRDPQYIADMRAYNLAKEAHEYKFVPDAVRKLAADANAPQYAPIADYIEKALEAYKAFNENKDYQKAIEATAYYDANLNAAAKSALRGISEHVYSYASFTSETSTTTAKVYARNLPATVGDYAKYADLAAFESYIADVDAPYTYAIYEEARAKYDALPASLLGELSEEAAAKINEITYFGLTHAASTETPEFPAFTKTTATYPAGASYTKVTNALPKMNTLVQQVVSLIAGNDLQTTISGLYTNANVTAVAQGVASFIESLGMGAVTPAQLRNRMATANEDGTYTALNPEWQGAVDALTQAEAAGNVWTALTYKNGDWFLDGDKESFSEAIAMHLTLLMELKVMGFINVGELLFDSLQFENEYSFEDNTYSQGSYENIVHIFEAIGIPCMDSVTYSEAVDAAATDDEKIVARIAPILNAVFDFLDTFAASPVTTLLDVLPNLATALNNGTINDNVQTIIGRISGLLGLAGVQLPTLDFTAEGIFDTIGGLGIAGITYDPGSLNSSGVPNYPNSGSLTVNIEVTDSSTGNPVSVPLTIYEADFIQFCKDMAGCGVQVVADSVCLDSAKRVTVDADQADAFVTLVRFVYDDVLMKNMDSVKQLITATEPTVGQLLGPVLDVIKQYLPADAAIVALVTVADPLPESGDIGGGGLGDLAGIWDTIRDFFNNLFGGGIGDIPIIGDIINGIGGLLGGGGENNPGGGSGEGTEQTGDPNIPTTGSTIAGIASSAIALAVGAAVTLLAVKSRRDRED